MLKINCHNEFRSFSNFSVTLCIIILLQFDAKEQLDSLNIIDYLIVSSFFLSIVSSTTAIRKRNTGTKKFFNRTVKISDPKMNRKVLEVWFMTMAPLLAISPDSTLNKWVIMLLILIILRLIAAQKLFVFNILYSVLGYNFFELTKDEEKLICITRLGTIELNEYIQNNENYVDYGNGIIYVKKNS